MNLRRRRRLAILSAILCALVITGACHGESPPAGDGGPPPAADAGEPLATQGPKPPAARVSKGSSLSAPLTPIRTILADDTTTTTEAELDEPRRVRIPTISVDAELTPVGLKANGEMVVPDTIAGWYDLGPKPGAPGPSVLVAHRSWNRQPGVFHRLNELSPGASIEVLYHSGRVERFLVEASELHDKSQLPVDRIWNNTEQPVLRLITCGGEFDTRTRSYRSNIIVFASP